MNPIIVLIPASSEFEKLAEIVCYYNYFKFYTLGKMFENNTLVAADMSPSHPGVTGVQSSPGCHQGHSWLGPCLPSELITAHYSAGTLSSPDQIPFVTSGSKYKHFLFSGQSCDTLLQLSGSLSLN